MTDHTNPVDNINYYLNKIIENSPPDKSDGSNYADNRIYAEQIKYWFDKLQCADKPHNMKR